MPRPPSDAEARRLVPLLAADVGELTGRHADAALLRELAGHASRALAVADAAAEAVRGADVPRVLEVGLGHGHVTTALRRRLGGAVELYAVEHPRRVDERLAAYAEGRDIRLEACDVLAEDLPWPGVAFGAAVVSEVVEHLPPDAVPRLLGAVAGRLAPGGRAVVTSPSLRSLHRRLSLAVGRGALFDAPLPLEGAGGTYGHLRLYAAEEIEALLGQAGLAPVERRYLDWETVYLHGVRRLVQRAAGALAPSLRTSWLVTAERRR